MELYFDECWGPFPGRFASAGFDLPVLDKLVLGNYCFADGNQLDWILAQGTLKTLHFDGCFITSHLQLRGDYMEQFTINTEDWTKLNPEDFAHPYPHQCEGKVFFDYPGTWAEALDRIREGLLNLSDFKLIYNRDDENASYRETSFGSTEQLNTILSPARYNNY